MPMLYVANPIGYCPADHLTGARNIAYYKYKLASYICSTSIPNSLCLAITANCMHIRS